MESGHGAAAVTLIEAGADRERVSPEHAEGARPRVLNAENSRLTTQTNVEGQVPEEIDGVGGQEQKNVRAFVVSKVGPRE